MTEIETTAGTGVGVLPPVVTGRYPHPALALDSLGPRGDGAGLAALHCPALNRAVMPEEVSMQLNP